MLREKLCWIGKSSLIFIVGRFLFNSRVSIISFFYNAGSVNLIDITRSLRTLWHLDKVNMLCCMRFVELISYVVDK
jgi:hypothetical protein